MTPLLAAPSGHPNPWPILAVVLVIAAAGYALSCWIYPFGKCLVCDGSGKRARRDGKVWRLCRWCKGTGRRLRIGRRVYNRIAARREAAR